MEFDTTRKSVTIYEDTESMTFLKPFSDEHKNSIYVILEDAFGEIDGKLISIDILRNTTHLPKEKLNEILNLLQ
jgi:hypothetical protein